MKNYGHYVFPDPGLFIHPATGGKYIESWLRVRDAWIMCVAKEPSLALSSQSWRTFLGIDDTVPEKVETKAARRRQEVLDILLPTSDMYPGVEKRSGSMGAIVWQGREYPSGVLLPEDVVREILWELYELNFIHELQSLDRRACGSLDLETANATQLFEREIDVSQCFHTSSFRHIRIPTENRGLADDDFDKRFRYITGLYYIVKSWKGVKPAMLVGELSDLSPHSCMELEKVVTEYYCQQFFNYFGRAAQVPHRIFP